MDPVRPSRTYNEAAARRQADGGALLRASDVTLVDTNGVALSDSAEGLHAELRARSPDAIVLCFPLDEPAALGRLASYWLPALAASTAAAAKPHWPYTPVTLCGTKEELFDEGGGDGRALWLPFACVHASHDGVPPTSGQSLCCCRVAAEATASWLAAYRHVVEALAGTHSAIAAQLPSDLPPDTDGVGARDAALAALRVAYPLVQGSLCVSARQPAAEDSSALEEVAAVLHQVRARTPPCRIVVSATIRGLARPCAALPIPPTAPLQAVSTAVYPAFPLYRPSDDEPTPEFSQAAERIFRVLDADRDGLLSQDELAVYMMHTTGLRLSEPDMETVLAVRSSKWAGRERERDCCTRGAINNLSPPTLDDLQQYAPPSPALFRPRPCVALPNSTARSPRCSRTSRPPSWTSTAAR
jgi:hypothetical protein